MISKVSISGQNKIIFVKVFKSLMFLCLQLRVYTFFVVASDSCVVKIKILCKIHNLIKVLRKVHIGDFVHFMTRQLETYECQ